MSLSPGTEVLSLSAAFTSGPCTLAHTRVVCFFMRFTNFAFELIFITTFPPHPRPHPLRNIYYGLCASTKRLFNCFYGSHRNF